MTKQSDVDEEFEWSEVEQEVPSDKTLERTPERVVRFIHAVAKSEVILGLLAARGYAAEDQAEAWELLRRATQLDATLEPAAKKIASDPEVSGAIDLLDAWDNEHFPIIEAALARRFPKQRAKLFENLQVQDGALSVVAVRTLLERLKLLAKGKLTDDAQGDKDANALLVRRMYGEELRAKLARAVDLAQSLPELNAMDDRQQEQRGAQRRAALVALYGWWKEWATTARKAIKRRDQLLLLGLVTRRPRVKEQEPTT
jgi:hypothetical protein